MLRSGLDLPFTGTIKTCTTIEVLLLLLYHIRAENILRMTGLLIYNPKSSEISPIVFVLVFFFLFFFVLHA